MLYPFKICDYYLYCVFAGEASCTIVHMHITQMKTTVTTMVKNWLMLGVRI